MSTWIDGTVGGGKLYCRKSPSTSAAAWGRFENGTKIKVRDVEGHPDWYETYWNNDVSKVGYVIRNYVDAIVMPEDVELTFPKRTRLSMPKNTLKQLIPESSVRIETKLSEVQPPMTVRTLLVNAFVQGGCPCLRVGPILFPGFHLAGRKLPNGV